MSGCSIFVKMLSGSQTGKWKWWKSLLWIIKWQREQY